MSYLVPSTSPAATPPWLDSRDPELDFLNRLMTGLVRTVSVERIANFSVELLVEDTRAENCSLMLLDKDSGELKIAAATATVGTGNGGSRADSNEPLKLGCGVAGWVASEQVPVRLEEASRDARFISLSASDVVVNSLMSFPLVADGEVLGVMNLSSPASGVFSERDEELVSVAADHIAFALERATRLRNVEHHNAALLESVASYQTRLTQAEKMSAVGSLLAGIVHELNNPLTTILGFSQLLAQTNNGDRKNLDRIVSESERCARIVQNVLRISRPGKAEHEIVDVNSCIRETVELAEYQLRLHRIELNLRPAESNPSIYANPCELTQVVLNLLTNAIQAIAGSGQEGTIDVTTWIDDSRVLIQVKDDGPGIGAPALSNIFEPFVTTKETGTGLGLSLSRELVRANGGDVTVESTPGVGTKFTLQFDVSAEDPGDDVTATKSRVLVVDDEHHILDLVDEVLPDSDYSVECVGSGEEAMDRLTVQDFDLLISDLRMPGISGRELVEWVRQNDKNAKVLLLTGDVASGEMRDFIASSGARCLAKPFRIGELIEAVEQVFSSGH